MGVDHPGYHPDHGRIELHAALLDESDQWRHIHVHRQAHDHSHVVHIKLKQIASRPGAEINLFVIHLNTPLHDCFSVSSCKAIGMGYFRLLHTSHPAQALHGAASSPRFIRSPPQ